jgi:hypothetical protein
MIPFVIPKWVNAFQFILFELSIVTSLNLVHRGTEDDGCRATGLGAGESRDNKILTRV